MSERWGDRPEEFEPRRFQFRLGTLLTIVFFLAILLGLWRVSPLAGLITTGSMLGMAFNAFRGANSPKWLAIGALCGLLIAGTIGALALIAMTLSDWASR